MTPFIRAATAEDVPLLLQLIQGLAEYEKLADQVTATEALLRANLFGEQRAAEALLAFVEGEAVGFALYFQTFSTFVGKPGLYLEDLFVRPEWRGRGIGSGLFQRVAQIAQERGCGRFEWSVLDWNKPAVDFYEHMGASALSDWTMHRLAGGALDKLASGRTGNTAM